MAIDPGQLAVVGASRASRPAEAALLAARRDADDVAILGVDVEEIGLVRPFGAIADTLFDELATPQLPADIVSLLLGTNDSLAFFLDSPTSVGDYTIAATFCAFPRSGLSYILSKRKRAKKRKSLKGI